MPNTILIDAGPLIALFDRDDRYHEKILTFIREGAYKLVTTPAVLTEVSCMLNFNSNVQFDFFEWVLKRGVILAETGQDDISRVTELIRKYRDRVIFSEYPM
ncbi:MAG: pilus assembly protein, partial [Spirochaetaceae bacterium]|nr:pilus assembly protein [Spirochaetaceae bacterium]